MQKKDDHSIRMLATLLAALLATYIAAVTRGTKDLAGNALDQDPATAGNQPKIWRFKVR